MRTNYNHLELMAVFATVVNAGSFTRASEILGCSKAHVSQQISRLEDICQAQLLFRTTRKLSLTEAGKIYLDYCADIVDISQNAHQALNILKDEMSGVIRLSCPISFGEVFISELTLSFMDQYPDITFELDVSNQYRDMKHDKIDVALRSVADHDEDLIARKVGVWDEYVCATPIYLEKNGTVEKPEDLLGHSCLINSHLRDARHWSFENGGEHFNIPVKGRISVNSYPMLKGATLKHAGIGRLPLYLIETELENGELIRLLEDYEYEKLPIYLVYPYQKSLPLKLLRFIEHIKDWFKNSTRY
jgi:DNA-binding transcriptional LysR family regulator